MPDMLLQTVAGLLGIGESAAAETAWGLLHSQAVAQGWMVSQLSALLVCKGQPQQPQSLLSQCLHTLLAPSASEGYPQEPHKLQVTLVGGFLLKPSASGGPPWQQALVLGPQSAPSTLHKDPQEMQWPVLSSKQTTFS